MKSAIFLSCCPVGQLPLMTGTRHSVMVGEDTLGVHSVTVP